MARRPAPGLADAAIVRALEESFGIRVAALRFLPVGNDAASWAYRVQAAQGSSKAASDYFLKVRAGAGAMPGAEVPSRLQRLGVPHVLAPLPTGAGGSHVPVDGFALALFPLLEAAAGAEVGLSPGQWRQLGAAVRRLHAVPTGELARVVGGEAFRPSRRKRLPELEALLADPAAHDPAAAELAGFWRARRDVIDRLVERADGLGRWLARRRFPRVLCHADLHTWNVLIDAGRRPWIVDWDEAVLAPRERDLMFVVGGIGHGLVRPRDSDRFFEGYGQARIDPRLLAYYRCAWAVQDIAAYGESVLLPPAPDEETRRAAVADFIQLFQPGNIVDLAMASE
jgi:spectinomycin phosphotransferase